MVEAVSLELAFTLVAEEIEPKEEAMVITGRTLSMLVIVTVEVAMFPAESVATKSKEPLAVKAWLVAFSVPLSVEAVTVIS